MTLSSGTRLGPYEVVAPIGAGGMGEVWKARDTRLERNVAIKLLPAEFAADAQLRLRFEREAKTISQLNDPHICTLYDVGHDNGRDYLVMEYIEGETLADRLTRGPLPLADVIRYGIQIAHALEREHAAGIVHRDLKPGNVMITKSGAKLLDFGLAKSATSGLGPRASILETQQKPLTSEGTILGTFQYMAPEQLEGDEADARTDIFGLGLVLYEMATGRRAFDGKTRTSLIAAIVDRDPAPISTFQPLTPDAFERVVATCLTKDPAERWQSAHDVRLELQWLLEREAADLAPRRQNRLGWIVAAILALIAAVTMALYVRSAFVKQEQPIIRTSIVAPKDVAFDFFVEKGAPEISPDGTKIAFIGTTNGVTSLWVRSLDSLSAQQLSGTTNAAQPFWSPDSRFIAFCADGAVKKIEWTGGAAIPICNVDAPIRSGSWGRNGIILIGRPGQKGVGRVPASGGQVVDATTLDLSKRDTTHRWPQFLPDQDHFLFLSGPHTADESTDTIAIGSLRDPKMKKDIIHASSSMAYVDGWILYTRDRILTAQKFNAKTLDVEGEPVALPELPVEFDPITARAFFSVSRTGTLLYQTGEGLRRTQLAWFDRSGKRIETAGDPQRYGSIALSPDGNQIAYSLIPRQNIWVYDIRRHTNTRVTFSAASEYSATWSPDMNRIAYASSAAQAYDIRVVDLRTGADEKILASANDKNPTSWSADGRYLLYTETVIGRGFDIMVYDFVDKKSRPYVSTPRAEAAAHFSPDGKWVVYQSSTSAPWSIFLEPFPPTGAKWQISPRVGAQPRWRADGKEVFYYGDARLNAVPIKLSTPPQIGQPIPLMPALFNVAQSWEISPDGQRMLINAWVGDPVPAAPLTVVQHFDAVLRQATEKRD